MAFPLNTYPAKAGTVCHHQGARVAGCLTLGARIVSQENAVPFYSSGNESRNRILCEVAALVGGEGLRLVGLPAGYFEELRFQTATFGKLTRGDTHIQDTAQNRGNNGILIDIVGR